MKNIDLKDFTLELMGFWSNTTKVRTLLFSPLLIISLGYFFVLKNDVGNYEKLKEEKIRLTQDINNKKSQLTDLDDQQKKTENMHMYFNNNLRKMVIKEEVAHLLENISKIGINSGLIFELFAPKPLIHHGFYDELPIKINVLGDYSQLIVFLTGISQISQIITLYDLVIERPTFANSDGRLIMKLTIKIYQFNDKRKEK